MAKTLILQKYQPMIWKSVVRLKLTFRQCLNLGSGDYLISLGLTRFEKDQLQVIHRRYDAVKIKVVNYDGSIGLANCFSSINLNSVFKNH